MDHGKHFIVVPPSAQVWLHHSPCFACWLCFAQCYLHWYCLRPHSLLLYATSFQNSLKKEQLLYLYINVQFEHCTAQTQVNIGTPLTLFELLLWNSCCDCVYTSFSCVSVCSKDCGFSRCYFYTCMLMHNINWSFTFNYIIHCAQKEHAQHKSLHTSLTFLFNYRCLLVYIILITK